MKILLAPLLLAVSLPAFAEIDPKIHKLCIEAKDYAGCVKAHGEIRGSNEASSVAAEAKTKEIYDKLYDFNKRQLIASNPSLDKWIKANPGLARDRLDKEFLFFNNADYKSLPSDKTSTKDNSIGSGLTFGFFESKKEHLYSKCLKRGATITSLFNWEAPCSNIKDQNTVSENNQILYKSILHEIRRQEEAEIANENCTKNNKSIRWTNEGSVCMSDFEYASYQEQQRSRRAQEAYRARMIRQGEIDRKNAANRRMWESINNSMKSLGETINPKRINCTTTYGSYTSNTSCY